jgi:MFS family permease
MAKSADPTAVREDSVLANENTPLLGAPEAGPEATALHHNGHANGHPKPQDTPSRPSTARSDGAAPENPMPIAQILLLCYISLSEPIAYFSIFPFMPEMAHLVGHIPQSSVGFWTGLIESLFSLVQMVTMILYGRAADRFGRKPVLVFSLIGVTVFTAAFGLGRTLGQIVLLRSLAGFFGGLVVTVRTMISENCGTKGQARAFSWYMFARNLGIFLGPLIGTSNSATPFLSFLWT